MRPESDRKPGEVQQAQENDDPLPTAIASSHRNQDQAGGYQRYADPRIYSHLIQCQIDGGELGYQSQEVYQL